MTTALHHRFLALAAALLMALAMGGAGGRLCAASRPVIHYVTQNSRKYLLLSDIAKFYQFSVKTRITTGEKTITLTNKHGQKILFTAEKVQCVLDGYQVNLCYKVFFKHGEFYLEETDFNYLLNPILRNKVIPRQTIKTIVLDPGHGGKDQGASYANTLEKSLNLLLAKRICAILKKRGYTVYMTREKDVEMSLASRSEFCAAKKADLYISVHCNAHDDADVEGIEVWIANPPQVPSFGTTTLGKSLAGTKPEFLRANALLGYLTLKSLVRHTKAADRGVRRKQLYVISHSPAPSMLVEFGFLSNDAERKKMLNSAYQDKLCAALCDAVDQFAKLVKPAPPKPAAANAPAGGAKRR